MLFFVSAHTAHNHHHTLGPDSFLLLTLSPPCDNVGYNPLSVLLYGPIIFIPSSFLSSLSSFTFFSSSFSSFRCPRVSLVTAGHHQCHCGGQHVTRRLHGNGWHHAMRDRLCLHDHHTCSTHAGEQCISVSASSCWWFVCYPVSLVLTCQYWATLVLTGTPECGEM
jgi:hypothetical protein